MKITLAQQNYTIAHLEGNYIKIAQVIAQSSDPVIIFGEGAITGSPLLWLDLEQKRDQILERIAQLAPQKEIFIGLEPYLVAYVTGGEVQYINDNYVQVGDAAIFFEADHFSHGAPARRLEELKQEAAEQALTIIRVNQVGASTDTVYYGGSVVCYSNGDVVMLPLWREAVVSVSSSAAELVSEEIVDYGSDVEQTHQAILLAIRDYFAKNNFQHACVALSGGIDSAVVVALAVEALGADRVRVVMLPSAYSSDHSVNDSLDMAQRCGIHYDIIEIEPIFQTALAAMEPLFRGLPTGLAEENMQSRIRLLLTMALSNKTGALMLNTSNKSEVAVGYGTLYGDTSGALGVIADLYKGEVYELANHLNRTAGDLIPQNIIDKVPSAELRPDQKDSDSLPEYPVLDAVLYRLVEQGASVEDVIAEGFDQADVYRAARLLYGGDFKRKQLPPAIRLSGMTFGVEYIRPITKHSLL